MWFGGIYFFLTKDIIWNPVKCSNYLFSNYYEYWICWVLWKTSSHTKQSPSSHEANILLTEKIFKPFTSFKKIQNVIHLTPPKSRYLTTLSVEDLAKKQTHCKIDATKCIHYTHGIPLVLTHRLEILFMCPQCLLS